MLVQVRGIFFIPLCFRECLLVSVLIHSRVSVKNQAAGKPGTIVSCVKAEFWMGIQTSAEAKRTGRKVEGEVKAKWFIFHETVAQKLQDGWSGEPDTWLPWSHSLRKGWAVTGVTGSTILVLYPFPQLCPGCPMFSERWLPSCLFLSPTNTENGGNWEPELEGTWEFSKYPPFEKKINEWEHRQLS